MDFLTFVTEKIKLVEPCLTPSPLNGQNNTKREERYLSTVPKIVPTLNTSQVQRAKNIRRELCDF